MNMTLPVLRYCPHEHDNASCKTVAHEHDSACFGTVAHEHDSAYFKTGRLMDTNAVSVLRRAAYEHDSYSDCFKIVWFTNMTENVFRQSSLWIWLWLFQYSVA